MSFYPSFLGPVAGGTRCPVTGIPTAIEPIYFLGLARSTAPVHWSHVWTVRLSRLCESSRALAVSLQIAAFPDCGFRPAAGRHPELIGEGFEFCLVQTLAFLFR